MSWAAVAGAGVGLVGSFLSSQNSADASQNAANAQINAANQSNATLQHIYDQTNQNLKPWMTVGGNALNQLATLNGIGGYTASGQPGQPGSVPQGSAGGAASGATGQTPDYSAFFNSPDYQFALQQGMKSLDASAAARGRLYAGGYGQDLTNYAQGMATQNLNNYENRLMSISGQGQQAGEFGGQLGMQFAGMNGQNLMNAGNAAANNYMNQAAAQNGFINNLGQMVGYGLQQWGGYTMNPSISPSPSWSNDNTSMGGTQLAGVNDLVNSQTPLAPVTFGGGWGGQ